MTTDQDIYVVKTCVHPGAFEVMLNAQYAAGYHIKEILVECEEHNGSESFVTVTKYFTLIFVRGK